jgi:hypothetical protein
MFHKRISKSLSEKLKKIVGCFTYCFLNTQTHEFSEERSKYAQNDLYNEIYKYTQYALQDMRETNNLLNLAGIDSSKLDTVPIETLQGILGVDNIVIGRVSYSVEKRQDVMTDSYTSTGTNRKKDRFYESGFSNTSVEENTIYDYKVYLDIYKDFQKIYSQTRVPLNIFGGEKDNWINVMIFLIKRCPLSVKR